MRRNQIYSFPRNGPVHFNRPGEGRHFSYCWPTEVCGISGSNAGYTVFRGSVKGTGYPLHSSSFHLHFPLPCVTVCRHISTGVYFIMYITFIRNITVMKSVKTRCMRHVACVDMIIQTFKNLVSTPEGVGPRSKVWGNVRVTWNCFLEPTLHALKIFFTSCQLNILYKPISLRLTLHQILSRRCAYNVLEARSCNLFVAMENRCVLHILSVCLQPRVSVMHIVFCGLPSAIRGVFPPHYLI